MDGTFVKALAEQVAVPAEINGMTAFPNGWTQQRPAQDKPDPLTGTTLACVHDFIECGVDALPKSELIVTASHNAVHVRGRLENEAARYRRNLYLVSQCVATDFKFGEFMDTERFIVGLQSCFVQSEARDAVLKLVSSITESTVGEAKDDGFAQTVKVSRGVVFVGEQSVPNPVRLAPYRTFREIAQPESLFVLRLSDGPRIALFEADGGAWRIEATNSVAKWLRDSIPGVAVVG